MDELFSEGELSDVVEAYFSDTDWYDENGNYVGLPSFGSMDSVEYKLESQSTDWRNNFSNEREVLIELMSKPNLIRNVALIGHYQHGKTIVMDMLIEHMHNKSTFDDETKKHMRFTDTRDDEQDRAMSIKCIPMSLVVKDSNAESYLCNIMDTPGHIDFSDEMCAALRISDGAVLVVDAAEGVMMNTERSILHAIQERLPIVLVISKVDRLITELRLEPLDAYNKLRKVIEAINTLISTFSSTAGFAQKIDPARGEVCFSSASTGWSFTLLSFAKQYVKRHGISFDATEFASCLWGDYSFDPDTSAFTMQQPSSTLKRSFVQLILEPIYDIYSAVSDEHKESVQPSLKATLAGLGVTLSDSDYQLNVRSLLRLACSSVFGSATGFTDMLVEHIPSAKAAASIKVGHIYTGPKMESEIYQAMQECKPDGPLMANVTKLYPIYTTGYLYAFGRVYSGKITTGLKLRVISESYRPHLENISFNKVRKLWVYQARYRIPVSEAPPGSWVLIEGLDASIVKTATLCNRDLEGVYNFRPLQFNTLPVWKCSVESEYSYEMTDAFDRISNTYPLAITRVEPSGEHTVIGTGELYHESIVKDLAMLYRVNLQPVTETPYVSFRESVQKPSDSFEVKRAATKSPNQKFQITMIAEPLEEGLVDDIENNVVSIDWPKEDIGSFLQNKYNWDPSASQSVWSFGPSTDAWTFVSERKPGNILLDDTHSSNVDREWLDTVKHYIVQGFEDGTLFGPLCDEPIRNVKFKIVDVKIGTEPSNLLFEDIYPVVQRIVWYSFLVATPRLLEPVYRVELLVPEECVATVKTFLESSRGIINEQALQDTTSAHIVKMQAYLPVMMSFGLERKLKEMTLERACCTAVFSHWGVVPGDPMESHHLREQCARRYTKMALERKGRVSEGNEDPKNCVLIEIEKWRKARILTMEEIIELSRLSAIDLKRTQGLW